jgi:hypothetical protein
MANLEDTVRTVVQDFITNETLFTALDVSNEVKKALPNAKHREVRDVVRSLFATEIETKDWARTPITVILKDGSTAEALLYHSLSDSWNLDSKYDAQKRAQVAAQPFQQAQAVVAQAQVSLSGLVLPVGAQVVATQVTPTVVTTPMPTARTLWDQMFQTQPSLFPSK